MSWRRIHALGTRLTPQLARRLADAFRRARGRVPVGELTRILETGDLPPFDIERIVRALPELIGPAASPLIRLASQRAAQMAFSDLGLGPLEMTFEQVNPRAVQAANTQIARLVTVVTEESRRAIRAIVAASIEHGITVRDSARLIEQVVGLNRRQAMALAAFRRRLVETGVPRRDIDRQVERYHARLLRQRATMIARTETITALSRGQEAVWNDVQARGYLTQMERVWIVTPDDRLCPVCKPLDGARAPIGGMFATQLGATVGPPLHPSCRCTQGLVAVRQRARQAA